MNAYARSVYTCGISGKTTTTTTTKKKKKRNKRKNDESQTTVRLEPPKIAELLFFSEQSQRVSPTRTEKLDVEDAREKEKTRKREREREKRGRTKQIGTSVGEDLEGEHRDFPFLSSVPYGQ